MSPYASATRTERQRVISSKHYRRNREARSAQMRAWRASHPEKVRLYYRRWYFKKVYGITLAEADALLSAAHGRCGICGCPRPLHVDHDHATGRVRGLLCKECNLALGGFRDSIELLAAATQYLANPPALSVLATSTKETK